MDLLFGIKKNKKEDKDQFLKAQKEARQQREKAKQQEKSAIRIQSVYRGSKVRENTVNELKQDRLKKLSDVMKVGSKFDQKTLALLANKLLTYKDFLAILLFIKRSNAINHIELVKGLAYMILKSLNTDESYFFNILNNNKDLRYPSYIKMKRALYAILEVSFGATKNKVSFQTEETQKECEKLAVELLLKLVRITPQDWPSLTGAFNKNQNLNLEFAKQIKHDIKFGLSIPVIQNLMASEYFLTNPQLRVFLIKLICERDDATNKASFTDFLGMHSFYDDLASMRLEKRIKLISSLVKKFEWTDKNLNPKLVESLLTKLIEFFSFAISEKAIKEPDYQLIRKMFGILKEAVDIFVEGIVNLPENQKIKNNTMDLEEEKDFSKDDIKNMKKEQIYKAIIEKNQAMLLKVEPNTIQELCNMISRAFNAFSKDNFEQLLDVTCQGCELMFALQLILGRHERALMKNILAFKLNFYYIPFQCLQRQGFNVESLLYVPEKYIPIIRAFAKIFYHTLRITDDEEFMGNNEIIQSNWILFNTKELLDICAFFNKLLFLVIWKSISAFESIKNSSLKLLRELFSRDSRLKFCPKDFWTIPELKKMSEEIINSSNPLKEKAIKTILNQAPHMLPFETRIRILQRLIETDKNNYDRIPGFDPEYDLDDEDDEAQHSDPKLITIRRPYILEDGFEKITKRRNMRSLFMIRFVNEHGMVEEGIDGGGLLKEFMTLIGKIVFDPNYGLFLENDDKTLVPNPHSYMNPDHLKLFYFIGRLVGKAIYEYILFDSVFSVIFLNRILGVPNTINELKYADPTLYKNLMLLKHRNDVADSLNLTFSVDETAFGGTQTYLLKADGDKIEVNESNKIEYISLFCNYKLNKLIEKQSQAFTEGLKSVIDIEWIRMFNHEELQFLISGQRRAGFDVEDLRQNVEYRDFTPNDLTIKYLWEVLNEMTDEERSKFLLFVTGCSRPPTLGFKFLQPKLAIHNASHSSHDIDKLPTASTCANLFKLPDYKNKELLRKKLMYAINANAGFDLG